MKEEITLRLSPSLSHLGLGMPTSRIPQVKASVVLRVEFSALTGKLKKSNRQTFKASELIMAQKKMKHQLEQLMQVATKEMSNNNLRSK